MAAPSVTEAKRTSANIIELPPKKQDCGKLFSQECDKFVLLKHPPGLVHEWKAKFGTEPAHCVIEFNYFGDGLVPLLLCFIPRKWFFDL